MVWESAAYWTTSEPKQVHTSPTNRFTAGYGNCYRSCQRQGLQGHHGCPICQVLMVSSVILFLHLSALLYDQMGRQGKFVELYRDALGSGSLERIIMH